MKYKALTIAREYGSGGGEIAVVVAKNLGWRLVDKDLVTEISRMGQVSPNEVAAFDEKVDRWIHRITRLVWGAGADGVSPVAPIDMFDADKAAQLAKRVVEQAYTIGNCVIVGRGSQCILRDRKDAFHAFVYGQWEDKVNKIRSRVEPGVDAPSLIRSMDAQRIDYIRVHYKENWKNPHLYDIMINSHAQIEKTAGLIVSAMELVP